MQLEDIKHIAEIFQAFITALALIIGGIWTYLLFVSKRQRFPRAKVEHRATQRTVNTETTLLSIDILISNTGDVLLALDSGEIEVRQVLPPRENFLQMLGGGSLATGRRVELVDWPTLFSYSESWLGKSMVEIEPGGSEQLLYTLLVQTEVKTIYIQSYFRNVVKRRKKIGWRSETFHDVLPGSTTSSSIVQTEKH